MPRNVKELFLGFVFLGAVLLVGALVLDRWVTTPEDRAFRAAFREVAAGMSEERVLDLLGAPDERSPHFFLAQELGFEDAYRRAAASNSVYFLVWRRGIDLVYSVGISELGEVAIAECGGT